MICSREKKQWGTTLIELLVVMGISSALLFCTVPFGRQFLRRNELDQRVNLMANAVKFARNQSFILGDNLILSGIEGDRPWQSGMQLSSQATHKILRQWHWHTPLISMTWKGFKKGDSLVFSDKLEEALLSGSFLIADDHQVKRKIVINRMGRTRIEKSS